MSQLGLILQESLRPQREARTILGLLTEHMDGTDRETTRRRTLKERFRFAGMGCCGATWVFRPIFRHEQQQQQHHQEEEEGEQQQQQRQVQDPNPVQPECENSGPSGSGMNLATALAAERQMRGSEEVSGGGGGEGGTPWRVSLMRLLEETEKETEKTTVMEGNDSVCCVCMGRKKGAAFIPCGHTFCRVCSRELWLNRGSCPLCNRSILEILDIF